MFYAYFIKVTCLKQFPIGCVLVQSYIGTYLLFLLLQQYFTAGKTAWLSVVCIFVLTCLTPYAWFVSQLNPDIFIAYFVLSVLGLLAYAYNKKWVNAYFIAVIYISVSVHNSILLLCLFCCLAGGVYTVFKRQQHRRTFLLWMLAGTVTIYCLAANMNYNTTGIFSPNPSGHVFLMSRIAEMGLLKDVLKEECPVKNYEICSSDTGFRGRQWDFMW